MEPSKRERRGKATVERSEKASHKSFELLVWLLLTPVPLVNIRPQFLLSVRDDLLGISDPSIKNRENQL